MNTAPSGAPSTCPFCQLVGRDLVAQNDLAVAFRDGFPVNPGHTLIIPRRHVPTWFEASREEQIAILDLADQVKTQLDAVGGLLSGPELGTWNPEHRTEDPKLGAGNVETGTRRHPDGYNLGLNCGEAAGQTVPHLHLHVIPRFRGDVDDPTGGVRFVIPARGNYRNPGFIPGLGGASLVTESLRREGTK